jgi:hypothetical protein
MINVEFLEGLNYSWTATVILNNNKQIEIWYTCIHSIKYIIKEVVCVSSDLPKFNINN